jgi:hypothetical protein
MSAMNIDRALEVLERELASFEENQGQERPEETSADQATLEKYTELWRRLRSDMEKVADFMNRRGYSITVGTCSSVLATMLLVASTSTAA